MGQYPMRVVWRYACLGYGGQYAMMPLVYKKLLSYADNLDTTRIVCKQNWIHCMHSESVPFLCTVGAPFSRAYFGQGNGIIHMDNLRCNGSENKLTDCPYSRDTTNDNHGEDAGVRCSVGQ